MRRAVDLGRVGREGGDEAGGWRRSCVDAANGVGSGARSAMSESSSTAESTVQGSVVKTQYVRVAVVQLEYHPAISFNMRSPLEDPGGLAFLLPAAPAGRNLARQLCALEAL